VQAKRIVEHGHQWWRNMADRRPDPADRDGADLFGLSFGIGPNPQSSDASRTWKG